MNRGLDFKHLEMYPINIDNFDGDIARLVDSVYVGPQGSLLQAINRFNNAYNTDIAITKHFTLKPGSYDKIKKAYTNWVLRWDMKPRGVGSIFDRINQYSWRSSSIKDNLLSIERQMLDLRSTGIAWQDNTEDFNNELEKIRGIIITALDKCKDIYPNVDIKARLLPCQSNINDRYRNSYNLREYFPTIIAREEARDYILTFHIHIKDPTMTIYKLNSLEVVDKYEIPCGDIIVASGVYLLPLISRNWGRVNRRSDESLSRSAPLFLECMYLSRMALNAHPYISVSTDSYTWELDNGHPGNASNICTGNMASDIKNTLMNVQIEAHITHIINWLTSYYIPQTNPLNNISTLKRVGAYRLFDSRIYAPINNNPMEWEECTFPPKINRAIRDYAKGTMLNYHASNGGTTVAENSDLFIERKEMYLQHIKIKDLPCEECLHNKECPIYVNIALFLGSYELTPMDEAYLGFFIEIYDYYYNDGNRQYKILHYAEETIQFSDYYNPSRFYDRMIMANNCARRWYEANNEEVDLDWIEPAFRSRFYCLMSKSESDLKALCLEAENPDSKLVWNRESITEFHRPAAIPDSFEELVERHSEVLEDNRNSSLENTPIDENMTAEERTLLWATQLGGANNL